MITIEEFIKRHNYAPCEFYEIAELLTNVDDEKIAEIAKTFLEAKENLEMTLDNIGFEFG